jgi:hypothetical protein
MKLDTSFINLNPSFVALVKSIKPETLTLHSCNYIDPCP